MTETFHWDVTTDTSGGGDFRVSKANFGDSYTQTAPKGFNNDVQKWNVVFTGSHAEVAEVLAFVREHQGATAFYWTPPFGEQGFYLCTAYRPSINGTRARLGLSFEQTNVPDPVA